jgi:hypothetical protein
MLANSREEEGERPVVAEPAVRAELVEQAEPAGRAGLAEPEALGDQAVPVGLEELEVQAASVALENRAASAELENQAARVGLADQEVPAELVLVIARAAAAARLIVPVVARELEIVRVAELAPVAALQKIKSAIGNPLHGHLPRLAVAEDLAVAAAETTPEPAATEVAIAWAAVE